MNPIFLLLIVGGIYLKTLSTEALWQEALRKATESEIADMYTFHKGYTNMSQVTGALRDRLTSIHSV